MRNTELLGRTSAATGAVDTTGAKVCSRPTLGATLPLTFVGTYLRPHTFLAMVGLAMPVFAYSVFHRRHKCRQISANSKNVFFRFLVSFQVAGSLETQTTRFALERPGCIIGVHWLFAFACGIHTWYMNFLVGYFAFWTMCTKSPWDVLCTHFSKMK